MRTSSRPMRSTFLLVASVMLGAAISRPAQALELSGMLTDPQGKPVAGATIDLLEVRVDPEAWPGTPSSQRVIATATGKADGTYALDIPIPAGNENEYCLRAVAPGMGYCVISVRADYPEGQRFAGGPQRGSMKRPWFIMLPGHTERGIVVDEAGQPVAGCLVRFGMGWDPVRTNAAGEFQFEHFTKLLGTPFSDSRILQFAHPDFVRRTMWLRSEQHTLRQADGRWRIELRPGVMITGRVIHDQTGQAVPGAVVTFSGSDGRATTAADGSFSVRILPDVEMTIFMSRPIAGHPEYEPVVREARRSFPSAEPVVRDFDFHLRNGQPVIARDPATVLRAQPQPSGLQLTLIKPDGSPAALGFVRDGPNPIFAGLDGKVMVRPRGRSAQIIVGSDFTGELAGVIKIGREVDLNTPLTIQLGPTARISGRVVDGNGKPIADQHINLSYSSTEIVDGRTLGFGSPIGSAWTDADGRYTITGIVSHSPTDRIAVSATQMASHPILDLRSGQSVSGLNFRMTPGTMGAIPEHE